MAENGKLKQQMAGTYSRKSVSSARVGLRQASSPPAERRTAILAAQTQFGQRFSFSQRSLLKFMYL